MRRQSIPSSAKNVEISIFRRAGDDLALDIARGVTMSVISATTNTPAASAAQTAATRTAFSHTSNTASAWPHPPALRPTHTSAPMYAAPPCARGHRPRILSPENRRQIRRSACQREIRAACRELLRNLTGNVHPVLGSRQHCIRRYRESSRNRQLSPAPIPRQPNPMSGNGRR
jgi:hypothetical protein